MGFLFSLLIPGLLDAIGVFGTMIVGLLGSVLGLFGIGGTP